MGAYASLEEIRQAILEWRLIRFTHEGVAYLAEPHLLGHARRTRALVLVAWTRAPQEGWRCFRYSMLRGLDLHRECFPGPRPGYLAVPHRLIEMDTVIRRTPDQVPR